jgi:hypothetical protein
MKLAMMNRPATANVQFLYRERSISHGAAETTDATVAPSPSSTSKDGNAQHSSVPTDVKSERYLNNPPVLHVAFISTLLFT